MVESNDTGARGAGSVGSWSVGGVRVLRTDDYLRAQREMLEADSEEVARLAAEAAAAQAAYQAKLRAFAPIIGDRNSPHGVGVVLPAGERHDAVEALADEPHDELTDHDYDGIKEYDNPTPGWWHLVFIVTIVFSALYVVVYHFSGYVPGLNDRHALAEARALQVRYAELNDVPMGEAKLLQIMGEPSWLDQGAVIYAGTCALCHGQNGEGLIGPNMTDDYYKNATDLMSVATVISEGAANGAMPAQKNALNENEIALVAAYMASLRGQNLPSPREPEGEIIPPWPTLNEDGEVVEATGGTPQAAVPGAASGDAG
jgi:cytochrome c oxidase cbb3-type subunit 3